MGAGAETSGSMARRALLRVGLPVVAAAAIALTGFGGQHAGAAATCTVVGNVGIVVPTSSGTLTISRDAGGSLSEIRVNGSTCGFVGTTSALIVEPTLDNVDVVIDQTNGRFEPGLGVETGTPEIEFEIDGGAGADSLRIIGGPGDDSISFGANGIALNTDDDTDITTAAGLESFVADTRDGADTITGAGGTNGTTGAFTSPITFFGGTGDDTLRGGSSTSDVVDYSNLTNGVDVDLKAGTAAGDGNDTVADIENVVATSYDDTVALKPDQINSVDLRSGDDVCAQVSRGVNDGGVEGDSCDGGAGTDTYDGSGILRNSPGISIDFITGKVTGSGPDLIPGIEHAVGTNGEDVVTFKPDQINVATLLGGDDVCKQVSRGVNDGGVEGDTCDGGPGTDTYDATGVLRNSPGIVANLPLNKVTGSGPDNIPGVENFNGTNGEDEIVFQPDELNVANMGGGQDVCKQVSRGVNDGGVEGDTCNGEAGIDTYDASGVLRNSPGVSIDFLTNKVTGSGPDLIPGVENGIGTTGDDNFVDADDDCNLARGLGGDDVWYAGFDRPGSENDPARGVCGDDVDLGEGGEAAGDTLDYAKTLANSPGVIMNLPLGKVTGSPEDRAANAENAFGSEHDDIIIGSTEDNVLLGRGGNDVISGGGGNDTMDGGEGTDTLTSTGSDDGVTCDATGQPRSGTEDTTSSFEQCQAGSGDDVIYGTAGNDVINGGDGNDRIYGLQGDDVINGGNGDDFIDGGNGNDTINGGAGNDVLQGGSNGGDTLNGDAGDDRLSGGNGPDKLDGGPDVDILDGGEGPDACKGESKANCES